MNMQAFLDELLRTGKDYVEKGQSFAEDKLNIAEEGEERAATLDGMKKGALAAGALAVLLGTGRGRKLTGAALKVGSLAAVGGLAWKAWQNHSQKQAQESETGSVGQNGVKALSVDKLDGEEANERSQILIKAMLAAAKADGKIEEAETSAINEQIARLGLDQSIEELMHSGMVTPLSAKAVARLADNQTIAREIYLVSVLITNQENSHEKRYMENLAAALELPSDVVMELESYRK